jgi:hypothetical protein
MFNKIEATDKARAQLTTEELTAVRNRIVKNEESGHVAARQVATQKGTTPDRAAKLLAFSDALLNENRGSNG